MTAKSGQAALDRGDQYDHYDSGMCQKYVRGPCWDVGSLYGSAIDAWYGAHKKHPGDRNPPTGAPCYYRGGNYGHAVIYRAHDSGKIRSTDCQTTGQVNNDSLSWPERAWGYEYLGWTEDINGVDLPLGGGGGAEPGEDEDMPEFASAKRGGMKMKAGVWYPIEWEDIKAGEDVFVKGGPGIKLSGRKYTATLTARVTDRNGQSVRTSWVERADDETEETNPTVTHDLANLTDTRVGRVANGRHLRARILCDGPATLERAGITIVYW